LFSFLELINGQVVRYALQYALSNGVGVHATGRTYASADDQWARPTCPALLSSSSKTKPCQFSLIQSSCVALFTHRPTTLRSNSANAIYSVLTFISDQTLVFRPNFSFSIYRKESMEIIKCVKLLGSQIT